jgi:hypothetical protein
VIPRWRGVNRFLARTNMIPLGRGFSNGCYVFDFRIGAGKYFVLLFVGAT